MGQITADSVKYGHILERLHLLCLHPQIRINLPNTELDIIYAAGQCRRLPGEGHYARNSEKVFVWSLLRTSKLKTFRV